MNTSESLELYGLRPNETALPAIREILRSNTEAEKADGEHDFELCILCCVQLFSGGHPEDVFEIWAAKHASFDASIRIESQFLCGAGVEETLAFLHGSSHPEAREILTRIRDSKAAGDFDEFSTSTFVAHYAAYFGNRRS